MEKETVSPGNLETQSKTSGNNGNNSQALSRITDPIALQLIEEKRFEIAKFQQCEINWLENYSRLPVRTIAEALQAPTPSLATLRKYKGDAKMKLLLIDMLMDVVDFFNVGKSMSDKQLLQTAELIIDQFYQLTIADFRLAFNYAKSGKYGQLYDRLDGQVIIKWLALYAEERLTAAMQLSQKAHNDIKGDPKPGEMDKEGISKMITIFRTVLQQQRKRQEAEKAPALRKFESLADYADHHGIPRSRVYEGVKEQCEKEWHILYPKPFDNFELFMQWRTNGLLYQASKKNILISKILNW